MAALPTKTTAGVDFAKEAGEVRPDNTVGRDGRESLIKSGEVVSASKMQKDYLKARSECYCRAG